MVVVDASVVFKWLVAEDPDSTKRAQKLLENFLKGHESIIAPDILLYELANIFGNKAPLSLKDALTSWQVFTSSELDIIPPDNDFLERCIRFAKRFHVSIYDASYAVLARDRNAVLITADTKFAKQVNLPFVKELAGY